MRLIKTKWNDRFFAIQEESRADSHPKQFNAFVMPFRSLRVLRSEIKNRITNGLVPYF